MKPPSGYKELTKGLSVLQLDLDEGQIAALMCLAEQLETWSQRISLTGHRGVPAIVQHLILESLALGCALPSWSSLVDLGSGAGFPGLPLAIAWPECEVHLVESREKRVHFQRAAIRALGIANATPLHGRVEDLDPKLADAVVAMAMAKPEQALELMASWVGPSGYLALPLGEQRPHLDPPQGFQFEGVADYALPGSSVHRALWLARRL
ncbi:MAG: 16S rRNA (guanine(527)-N(7))-methyltransferase RsmG [Deltaproteobacteria bacterium]|nr:16S rRNA (guanine(527)-N(7))-methyltransferase RsmG [Deltaproteobacteria bacterium]